MPRAGFAAARLAFAGRFGVSAMRLRLQFVPVAMVLLGAPVGAVHAGPRAQAAALVRWRRAAGARGKAPAGRCAGRRRGVPMHLATTMYMTPASCRSAASVGAIRCGAKIASAIPAEGLGTGAGNPRLRETARREPEGTAQSRP